MPAPTSHRPRRARRPSRLFAGVVTIAAAAAVAFLYLRFVVPWEDTWGATTEDMTRSLPGDASVPNPYHQLHHVVTIDAPPEKVWPWLVQLGQDRAGFYSYHWLENIFLAGIRNTEEVRPEWQARKVGDFVPAVQPSYLGGVFGEKVGWSVTIVQPPEALALGYWGTFAIVRLADGRSRLIARQRRGGPELAVAWLPVTFLFDPSHFVMERRMLLRIKELAEGRPATPGWLGSVAWYGWVAGAVAVVLTLLRRRRWLSLVASLAVAAVVWYVTGDLLGALAAYMGLGLAAICVALGGRWAGMWIIGLGAFTYGVLALAPDAWVVFGVSFAAMSPVLIVALRRGPTKPRGR